MKKYVKLRQRNRCPYRELFEVNFCASLDNFVIVATNFRCGRGIYGIPVMEQPFFSFGSAYRYDSRQIRKMLVVLFIVSTVYIGT